MKKEYHVTVLDEQYEISTDSNGRTTVNGRGVKVDCVPMTVDVFSVMMEGSVYEVSLQPEKHPEQNGDLPTVTVIINGRPYIVKVEDERSRLLKSIQRGTASRKSELTLRAPMPGLITRIEVQEGETIKEGQGLVILEAMKMENEIRASLNARVRSVHVKLRQSVDKGEAIITLSSI